MEQDPAYIQYRIAVPTEFAGVFSQFYYANNGTDSTVTHTLLPSYQTLRVFALTGDFRLTRKRKPGSRLRSVDNRPGKTGLPVYP